MIWDHSLAELEDFINHLNSFHSHTVSDTNVSFLDVKLSKNADSSISTDIHIKSTDVHQLEELKGYFQNRQYPENVIDSAFKKVSSQTQEEAFGEFQLENKAKNIVPFVVQYNTSLPNLGLTINKYWDLFNLSSKESLNFLHKL